MLNQYPGRPPFYSGRFRFKKHYYPVIHDLREKRASKNEWAEEFTCAQAIEMHPEVKLWVRNVEREPRFSFWLPTAIDYFYPDFVAELKDGRILAVEYKGEPYKTNDDSREKKNVGAQWEHSSGGKCLFLMVVSDDELGHGVARQIDDKFGALVDARCTVYDGFLRLGQPFPNVRRPCPCCHVGSSASRSMDHHCRPSG